MLEGLGMDMQEKEKELNLIEMCLDLYVTSDGQWNVSEVAEEWFIDLASVRVIGEN